MGVGGGGHDGSGTLGDLDRHGVVGNAETDLLIRGGKINVKESYEGIEGYTITVDGGEISIVASDDGMNAAGGSNSGGKGGFGGNFDGNSDGNFQGKGDFGGKKNTDEKADLKTDEGAAIVKVSSVMATTMWNKSNIEIPKNIVAGVATPEDVANAYGQPTEIINNTEQGSITYYYYEGEKVEDHKNLDRFIAVLFTRKDKDDNNSPVVMERISMQWENY